MTLDNMTGITEGSYTGFCKSQLITCNFVKACNGVCPFEDALKHADQMQTMNEQHTVDHDRDWIIGCIEHDGFIYTHRFDKANQIIHDALSAGDGWIPCSERLPEDSGDYLVCPSDGVIEDYSDCRDVMIIPYDADCEAFGWWTERYDPISLGFVDCDFDEFEVLAWMPLPKPYREENEE